jgi:hypothetical protein
VGEIAMMTSKGSIYILRFISTIAIGVDMLQITVCKVGNLVTDYRSQPSLATTEGPSYVYQLV